MGNYFVWDSDQETPNIQPSGYSTCKEEEGPVFENNDPASMDPVVNYAGALTSLSSSPSAHRFPEFYFGVSEHK